MDNERIGMLTQDEIVNKLHKPGYDDVNERRIAD